MPKARAEGAVKAPAAREDEAAAAQTGALPSSGVRRGRRVLPTALGERGLRPSGRPSPSPAHCPAAQPEPARPPSLELHNPLAFSKFAPLIHAELATSM